MILRLMSVRSLRYLTQGSFEKPLQLNTVVERAVWQASLLIIVERGCGT
jgi:hypothetical protein